MHNCEISQSELWKWDCGWDLELPPHWRTQDLGKKQLISLFKFGFLHSKTPTHISPPTVFHTLNPPTTTLPIFPCHCHEHVSVPIENPHRHPFSLSHFPSHSISLLPQFGKAYSFRRCRVGVQTGWNNGRSRMCHLRLLLTDAEHHLPDVELWKYTSFSAENKQGPLFHAFLFLTIGL